MLTERLRELEAAGLSTRHPDEEGARSHDDLTAKGDEPRPVPMALKRWAVRWAEADDER